MLTLQFCDGYVKRGSDGGRDAAVHLSGNLTKLLRAKANLQPHWKVIVRLYANISKLGEVYVSSGIIHNLLIWQNFVQAFNKESSLCEFVDAGGDKESADTRIKGQSPGPCLKKSSNTDLKRISVFSLRTSIANTLCSQHLETMATLDSCDNSHQYKGPPISSHSLKLDLFPLSLGKLLLLFRLRRFLQSSEIQISALLNPHLLCETTKISAVWSEKFRRCPGMFPPDQLPIQLSTLVDSLKHS